MGDEERVSGGGARGDEKDDGKGGRWREKGREGERRKGGGIYGCWGSELLPQPLPYLSRPVRISLTSV